MTKIHKIISICGVFLISSCSLTSKDFYWSTYSSNDTSVSLISDKSKNYKFTATLEGYTEIAENLLNIMKNKGGDEDYFEADAEYGKYYSLVLADRAVAQPLAQSGLDSKYSEIYQNIQNIISAAYSYYSKYYEAAATSTDTIQYDYYGTSDDAEIQQILNSGGGEPEAISTAKLNVNAIDNQAEEISSQFMQNQITAEQFVNQGADLFVQLKQNGNIIASHYGYDNYLDYMFDRTYGRSYTPDDVYSSFTTYINQYITPLVKSFEYTVDYDDLTVDEKEFYNCLRSYYLGNKKALPGNVFSDFAVNMGGEYLETYNHLWKDGYYVLSSSSNSQGTAFVSPYASLYLGEPTTYFSSNCQDLMTVVHEFGHYLNGYLNYSGQTDNDIDEVFSQANENLFLNYFYHNYSNKKYQRAVTYFYEHQALDYLKTIARGLVCFDAEYYAYNNDVDLVTLKNKWAEIGESYRDYLGDSSDYYYMYGLIWSPGYFISYATSVVASIEFFCKAEQDFNSAKLDYMSLVKSQKRSMNDYLEAGQVYSPFTEDCYRYIANNHPFLKTK